MVNANILLISSSSKNKKLPYKSNFYKNKTTKKDILLPAKQWHKPALQFSKKRVFLAPLISLDLKIIIQLITLRNKSIFYMEYLHDAKMIIFTPEHHANETFHHYLRHENKIKRQVTVQFKTTLYGGSSLNHRKKRSPPLRQQNL
ncbi:hypothetical protein ACS25B_19420 [Dickeya dadantii subsp. dieffenbachiae]|uniref:hypothetical protein n=1 Tax=Dickeya dadantii TaxID=204038 RepID=UPI00039ED1BB|nr:hypothetical protein [Dickeya dadantii]